MPIGEGAIACNTRLETFISRLRSVSSSLQHLCNFQPIQFTNSSCFLVPRRKKHQLDILTLDSPAERHNRAPSIHNVRKDVKNVFFPLNKLLIKKRLYWMKGGKKVIPEKAFSGKSEKIHSEGKKILRHRWAFAPENRFWKFMYAWRGACMGDGIRAAEFRIWVSRYGSGFLAWYIFIRGKGLGSARSLDCFPCPCWHFCVHRHTKNTHLPMWNHSERTQRLIFGNQIFRPGLERSVKKHCLHHFLIIIICSIGASSVRLAHRLKHFFLTHTWPQLSLLQLSYISGKYYTHRLYQLDAVV